MVLVRKQLNLSSLRFRWHERSSTEIQIGKEISGISALQLSAASLFVGRRGRSLQGSGKPICKRGSPLHPKSASNGSRVLASPIN